MSFDSSKRKKKQTEWFNPSSMDSHDDGGGGDIYHIFQPTPIKGRRANNCGRLTQSLNDNNEKDDMTEEIIAPEGREKARKVAEVRSRRRVCRRRQLSQHAHNMETKLVQGSDDALSPEELRKLQRTKVNCRMVYILYKASKTKDVLS